MNYNILLSHGIDPLDCSEIEYLNNEDEILIFLKIKPNQRRCIFCNHPNTRIKEYKQKNIKSLPTGSNNTIICFYLPRYVCPKCKKTYTHNISTSTSKTITNSLKSKLLEKFATVTTFKSIAKDFNLSVTEVIRIFDENCPDLRIPITEVFCIDEFYNIRDNDFKYACILIDFHSHKIIDIIPSRRTPYLDDYFGKISLKIRDNVKYVITDMYDGYISATKKWFRNANIAIDPFHYMRYITNAVQSIRRRILSCESKYFHDRSWMNSNWRLLTTHPDNFPKKNMTLKSGMTISYYDRVLKFVSQDKDLHYAFLKLQSIFLDLKNLSFNKADKYIDFIINSLLSSTLPEFVECGKTWNHYKDYIKNSFIIYKGSRLSNGPIEGTNKRIKELKAIMSGYRNNKRFYKKIIFVQNNIKR